MRHASLNLIMRTIRGQPRLSRGEERELFQRLQSGDKAAARKLVYVLENRKGPARPERGLVI